jgi:hypothetical protein
MLLEQIANALGGAKHNGEGYLCKCPCHEDSNASLSIKLSADGNLVCNCFAGCPWDAVKKELESRGLIEPFKPQNGLAVRGKPRGGKYDGAIFYVYHDLVGNIVCRKCKKVGADSKKFFWNERFEGGQWINKLDGVTVPLYNLPAVLKADVVYLAEGEKDAETLIKAGLCGTTSHAGAKSWGAHLTDALKGKTVVILPDNDKPGKERVGQLAKALHGTVKELRVFEPPGVPEKGDVTDWVEMGGDPAEIFAKSVLVEKKEQGKKATTQDYYDLIEQELGNPRRCIFSGKLMYKEEDTGLWNPCVNAIGILRAAALTRNETSERKFSKDDIQDHLSYLERLKPRELLVEVPEWDGETRISAMAYLVTLRESGGIDQIAFSELLKEWCGLVFQRLYDPMIQNRVLVLQGGQGIGKDTWTSMLVDGLGQFCVPLNVVGEDKDTYLSLTSGLVMKISEFDKTSRTEISTLKDLITAPNTNIRAPYDRDSKVRQNRCSFISSANAEQLLRDSTGNRRFMIFEVDKIEYGYKGWTKEQIHEWQMMCLAEMAHLGKIKYTASETSWRKMNDYIEGKTPEDFTADLVQHFIQLWRAYEATNRLPYSIEIDPNSVQARELTAQVAHHHGIKLSTAKGGIQTKIGAFKRAGSARFWVWRLPE